MSSSLQSHLSQIYVYPIKSTKGIALSASGVEKQGLIFDRRFMLADEYGVMVTARVYPELVKVHSNLTQSGMTLSSEDAKPFQLHFNEFSMEEVNAVVWGEEFTAYSTTEDVNLWFCNLLGKKVQLLYTGEQSNRVREKVGHNVSFADGYPLLIISEASLKELNRRSSIEHDMAQFRPNIVVSGDEPFVEDSWKKIQIGEVIFETKKPCQRCIMTTVDTETGQNKANKEPLNTLKTFRASDEGAIYFGQNLVALNEGCIKLDDPIVVLETQAKESYQDNELTNVKQQQRSNDPISRGAIPKQTVIIRVDGKAFEGDNQSTILNQVEKQGLHINNSCRVGLCEACVVVLKSGEVEQKGEPPISKQDKEKGRIFACCSIPKTDVEITS